MSQENSQVFQKNSQNWQKNNDNRTFFIKVTKFQLYYKRTPSWVFFCKIFERCFLKNISGRLHLFSPNIQVLIFYRQFVISLKEFNIMSVCSCYITSISFLNLAATVHYIGQILGHDSNDAIFSGKKMCKKSTKI